MTVFQFNNVGVDAPVAARHIHLTPSLTLIVGNLEGGRVAGETVCGIAAQPVGEDPASAAQNLNRLAAEAALTGKQRFVFAPGLAAVRAFLAANLRGELHVVLSRLTVELRGVDCPHGVVRSVEEGRILLAAVRVAGDVHRLRPAAAFLFEAGADDADVRAAFVGAAEPCAQQRAVRQLQQRRRVSGGITARGEEGFKRAHVLVGVDASVRGQPRQLGIINHTSFSSGV